MCQHLLNILQDLDNWNWNAISAIATTVASIIALCATYLSKKQADKNLEQLNRQLEIEQTPAVIVQKPIQSGGVKRLDLTIKNVGRGSAFNIVGSSDEKNKSGGFFSDDSPHSINLFPGEEFGDNKTSFISLDKDKDTDKIRSDCGQINEGGKIYWYFYLFYEDQMKTRYRTKIKVKQRPSGSNNYYVVMENKIAVLKS